MVSIKANGKLLAHHFEYLDDSLTRLFTKIRGGDYLLEDFRPPPPVDVTPLEEALKRATTWDQECALHLEIMRLKNENSDAKWRPVPFQHRSLLYAAEILSKELARHHRLFRSNRSFFKHIEYCLAHSSRTTRAKRIIITAADNSTCKSIYELFMGRTDVDHVSFHCLHMDPTTCHHFHRGSKRLHVLITTDKLAAGILRDMDPAVRIAIINYDTKQIGPTALHESTTSWTKTSGEGRIYKVLKGKYERLVSNFDQLLEQQLGEIGAATTIACWWRRTQLALKQHAANVIQQHVRSALCRIKTKRDQIAVAERYHAAKTIQVWRRSLVLQRKNRRLGAAALSNPLRERGLPLPPRSRNTVRRHKRREKGRRNLLKDEEGPQESLHDLQQSVQSLQESVNQLEHRNQQLVDTNTLLLQELSAIRVLLSNIGTNNETVLHNSSELSCRGNVIGNSLHNNSVSGSKRRESVSDKSHRHGGENFHTHDATITQDVIGAALPSRSSGSESVLESSRPSPISSSRGKSSRRRRRRRRHRRRYKRWKRGKALSNKGLASTSEDNHQFAIDCSKHQSTQTTAVNSKSTPSGTSRSISLDETHSISSTSISSPSTSSEMTSSPVVPPKDTTSDLEQPIPPDPNELQPLSSSTTIMSPSSTTTLVESTPLTSNITEEEPSTCHGKPISYLSALLGTTTNIG